MLSGGHRRETQRDMNLHKNTKYRQRRRKTNHDSRGVVSWWSSPSKCRPSLPRCFTCFYICFSYLNTQLLLCMRLTVSPLWLPTAPCKTREDLVKKLHQYSKELAYDTSHCWPFWYKCHVWNWGLYPSIATWFLKLYFSYRAMAGTLTHYLGGYLPESDANSRLPYFLYHSTKKCLQN